MYLIAINETLKDGIAYIDTAYIKSIHIYRDYLQSIKISA